MITRREFVAGTGIVAVAAALDLNLGSPALAQDVSAAELMQPSPLGDWAMGKDDAPVTVVEYASMTCSHCAAFHNNTYPELKKRYIDTGKVRYIMQIGRAHV